MSDIDTIVALSSGSLPSGVAIIRCSGSACREILKSFVSTIPPARHAQLCQIRDPRDGQVIDSGLVLWFPGPASFTGEDCLEFQIHGGKAVVAKLLDCLIRIRNVRLAEQGEFTKRAFENGRLDLTEVEGLADLIASETEAQRQLALKQSAGSLRELYSDWRQKLINIQALYAAEIDFADEDDIPDNVADQTIASIRQLVSNMTTHLADAHAGEIIRDGFRVAIIGAPNAGKSSLLNHLARRDVAIVTDIAGTTRDVIDVSMDIGGYRVIVSDTAGLRETDDIVEEEGVRRAWKAAKSADFIVWLDPEGNFSTPEDTILADFEANNIVVKLVSKDDQAKMALGQSLSSETGHGIDELLGLIENKIQEKTSHGEHALITRSRHRVLVEQCRAFLNLVSEDATGQIDLRAENIRLAADCLGRITGQIDIEELLDVVFGEFCVGK